MKKLFLLLLIKLAIFPHIGIFFIVSELHASDEPYRLEIIHEPNRLNKTPGNPTELYRSVCGMPKALEWAQDAHFNGVFWNPVEQYPDERDRLVRKKACDSRVVGMNEPTLDGEEYVTVEVGKNDERVCPRIEGCAVNLDAMTEEDYCPTCVWEKKVF